MEMIFHEEFLGTDISLEPGRPTPNEETEDTWNR